MKPRSPRASQSSVFAIYVAVFVDGADAPVAAFRAREDADLWAAARFGRARAELRELSLAPTARSEEHGARGPS